MVQASQYPKKHSHPLPAILVRSVLYPCEGAPGQQHPIPSSGPSIAAKLHDGRACKMHNPEPPPRSVTQTEILPAGAYRDYSWQIQADYGLWEMSPLLGTKTTDEGGLPEEGHFGLSCI